MKSLDDSHGTALATGLSRAALSATSRILCGACARPRFYSARPIADLLPRDCLEKNRGVRGSHAGESVAEPFGPKLHRMLKAADARGPAAPPGPSEGLYASRLTHGSFSHVAGVLSTALWHERSYERVYFRNIASATVGGHSRSRYSGSSASVFSYSSRAGEHPKVHRLQPLTCGADARLPLLGLDLDTAISQGCPRQESGCAIRCHGLRSAAQANLRTILPKWPPFARHSKASRHRAIGNVRCIAVRIVCCSITRISASKLLRFPATATRIVVACLMASKMSKCASVSAA